MSALSIIVLTSGITFAVILVMVGIFFLLRWRATSVVIEEEEVLDDKPCEGELQQPQVVQVIDFPTPEVVPSVQPKPLPKQLSWQQYLNRLRPPDNLKARRTKQRKLT